MSPILAGVVASGISGHLTPAFTPTGSYEAIASYTVPSGGVTEVNFAGIPSGYSHLQLRGILKLSESGTSDNWAAIQLNSTSNVSGHSLQGDGASVYASAWTSGSDNNTNWFVDGPQSGNTNIFAAFVTDVLDYSSNSKYKTIRTLDGFDKNGAGSIDLHSNLYASTNPVTSIKLFTRTGNGFTQYSSFALYGVK
jgi:hypothetical protein